MDHAGFYLYTGVPADVALNPQEAQTFAVVDRFGSRTPDDFATAGTYLGAMVGTPVAGEENQGDVLVGDARFTFDGRSSAVGNVTLDFTNIVNVDNGMAHSDISFDADLTYDGEDMYDNSEDRVFEAHFYGPNGEEVAGNFRRGGLIGAFGVQRQAE